MTKQQSQIMKGVAILMMIFYHLFNRPHNVALCHNLVFVDGTPLVSILSQVTNPVAFFLILGGYGLYKVYEKGDKHRWSRLLKLYIHYWAILLIFLVIGYFIVPTKYPGSVVALLKNVTGFETTYNGEMWFLFPYVVLSALSPFIFRIMAKFRAITIITITLLFIFVHRTASAGMGRRSGIIIIGLTIRCWFFICCSVSRWVLSRLAADFSSSLKPGLTATEG